MEHRLTKEVDTRGATGEHHPESLGIIDCDPRFAAIVADLADVVATDGDGDQALQLLVDRCIELQDVDAAIVTLEHDEGLRTEASSTGATDTADALDQRDEGPDLIAYHTRAPVIINRLEDARWRWPAFATVALEQGYRSTRAIPMCASSDCIGALNLFSYETGRADEVTVLAQTLAEVVTSGVLQRRRLDAALEKTQHLRHALDSRVVVEQAKGIMAERYGMTPDQCFESLRRFCRDRNLRIGDVATTIVNDEWDERVMIFTL